MVLNKTRSYDLCAYCLLWVFNCLPQISITIRILLSVMVAHHSDHIAQEEDACGKAHKPQQP